MLLFPTFQRFTTCRMAVELISVGSELHCVTNSTKKPPKPYPDPPLPTPSPAQPTNPSPNPAPPLPLPRQHPAPNSKPKSHSQPPTPWKELGRQLQGGLRDTGERQPQLRLDPIFSSYDAEWRGAGLFLLNRLHSGAQIQLKSTPQPCGTW